MFSWSKETEQSRWKSRTCVRIGTGVGFLGAQFHRLIHETKSPFDGKLRILERESEPLISRCWIKWRDIEELILNWSECEPLDGIAFDLASNGYTLTHLLHFLVWMACDERKIFFREICLFWAQKSRSLYEESLWGVGRKRHGEWRTSSGQYSWSFESETQATRDEPKSHEGVRTLSVKSVVLKFLSSCFFRCP